MMTQMEVFRMKRLLAAVPCIALLISCNLQPDNPLTSAARSGDTQAIAALLAGGAHPNQRWGVNSWTPLMHAIHKDQKGSVEALLAGGADVNARGGSRGTTALVMAAGYGYAEIVQLLLDKGADPRAETTDGDSALAAAVSGVPDIDKFTVGHCQTSTVGALLKKAPDLKLKDNFYGRAARLAAHAAGCADVVSLIERAERTEHASRGRV